MRQRNYVPFAVPRSGIGGAGIIRILLIWKGISQDMAEKAKSTTAKKTEQYNDQSIVMLKGADRVRLRPSVIFGSDGLDGCEHAFFEILSNAVDESR